MKKGSFVKDALVLCVITLVSGLLLGAVYGMTKETIYLANNASTFASYAEVMPASDYDTTTLSESLSTAMASGMPNGATLTEAVEAKDESGATIGYIVKGSAAGYGGAVVVVVGVNADLSISGISFPETLPETAGLGQKATEPEFYSQFAGKSTPISVVTGGGAGDSEIDAISGATITSTAVVNVVNDATDFLSNYVLK